jgi:hypothetical protein
MENLKLPVALVAAMFVQLAGGVWWVSQQAATISSLEETVSQLGSAMAIERKVNLQRDVALNAEHIDGVWMEIDDIWTDINNLSSNMMQIISLQQRVALIEAEIKYINRDHSGMLDRKGGMK